MWGGSSLGALLPIDCGRGHRTHLFYLETIGVLAGVIALAWTPE